MREYVWELDDKFPYWLFFLSKSGLGLQCLMFCHLSPYLTDEAQAVHHPKQLEDLLVNRWGPALNYVAAYAGLSEDDADEILERSMRYFVSGPLMDQ